MRIPITDNHEVNRQTVRAVIAAHEAKTIAAARFAGLRKKLDVATAIAWARRQQSSMIRSIEKLAKSLHHKEK